MKIFKEVKEIKKDLSKLTNDCFGRNPWNRPRFIAEMIPLAVRINIIDDKIDLILKHLDIEICDQRATQYLRKRTKKK